MDEREELKRQRAEWTVKKQEAKNRLKALLPDVMAGKHDSLQQSWISAADLKLHTTKLSSSGSLS
jgi:hypothetical protein